MKTQNNTASPLPLIAFFVSIACVLIAVINHSAMFSQRRELAELKTAMANSGLEVGTGSYARVQYGEWNGQVGAISGWYNYGPHIKTDLDRIWPEHVMFEWNSKEALRQVAQLKATQARILEYLKLTECVTPAASAVTNLCTISKTGNLTSVTVINTRVL